MSGSSDNLFHADHPRRLIPELSAVCHRQGWFNATGCGGFFSIRQGDSVYVAASNVVKNRLDGNDLFVYKVSDSSVTLSPPQEKKLEPCEVIGLIMFIFKERKGTGAVLHSNGQDPVLASLMYTDHQEFKIKDQAAIKGIYNESLKRNYHMTEELRVPIIHHSTESALRQAIKNNPQANAVIVRNQGMFVWAENWQKCQAMAESYHLLTGIAVQMEKLGLNPYTHNMTADSTVAMNDSINNVAAAAAAPAEVSKPAASTPAPKPAAPKQQQQQQQQPKSPVKKVTPTAKPAAAAVTTTPKQPEVKTATASAPTSGKKANGTVAKTSVLKKTSNQRGGKVTKRGGQKLNNAKSPAHRQGRGGGNNMRASPAPQQQQQGGAFNGPPNMGPPMMGPPMGGPPMGMMGPPMGPGGPMMGPGGPMMGPGGPMVPMGPGPMGGPRNFNQNKRNSGGRGGNRGGRAGRGGRGGGQAGGAKKNAAAAKGGKNNKAGVAKDVLMNY